MAKDCSTISVTSATPVGGSDHLSINVHINSPTHPHPIGSVKRAARWRWLPHNVLCLRQSLADADLIGDPPLDTPDSNEVTELWTNWRNTVLQLTSMHCSTPPIKLASNRNPGPSRPWITKELLISIKEKHKKCRIYLRQQIRQQLATIHDDTQQRHHPSAQRKVSVCPINFNRYSTQHTPPPYHEML